MAKVIIFGCEKTALIAHHYLTTDSNHEVVAFSVNSNYLKTERVLKNLPIIAFEDIEKKYPVEEYSFFAPFNSTKMNTVKESIYNSIKEKGYKMITFVSSKAYVNTTDIGDNCFILEGNVLSPFSKVGNNVFMWQCNILGHHSEIKNHVTLTANVVINGDCVIGENSYLGSSSTIQNQIVIAKGTLVSMGTSIRRNTKEWSIYLGSTGKKIGDSISKSIL